MGHEGLVRLVRPMNTTDRILGEARKVRPPTRVELKDPEMAYRYALKFIKGRWPEGEAAIATSPQWANKYAHQIVHGRWPEGEAAIAKDTDQAMWYVMGILKRRWPEGEAAIATSPLRSYYYAHDILKGRFPEGEATIATATDPYWAQAYLKRFPEAKREWVMRGWLDWFDL